MHKTQKRSNIIKKTAIIDKMIHYMDDNVVQGSDPYEIVYWGLLRLTIQELECLKLMVITGAQSRDLRR